MTKKITDLDPALPLTGAEVLPLVQNVVTRRSPLSALADWVLKTYGGFIQSGTGAVARTAQDKLRESVSVKDFGAVGDGVTDDTAAIQAAIDAATLYNVPLLVPGGVYICGTVYAENIKIIGGGTIRKKPQTKGIMLSLSGDNLIDGVVLDYDWGNALQATPYASNSTVHQAQGILKVTGCKFTKSFSKAISVVGGSLELHDSSFLEGAPHNNLGGGLERVTSYVDITAETLTDDQFINISGNSFLGQSTDPAQLHLNPCGIFMTASGIDGVRYKTVSIANNTFIACGQNAGGGNVTGAIDTYNGVENLSISNNNIRLFSYAGIKVQNSSNFSITGNLVSGGAAPVGAYAAQSFGIISAEKARGATSEQTNGNITGNTIKDCQYIGIQNSCEGVVIASNVIDGVILTSLGDAIYNTGAKTTMVGNVCRRIQGTFVSTISADFVKIIGNIFNSTDTASAGAVLFSGKDIDISNNSFKSDVASVATGIRTNGSSSKIRITANHIDGFPYGIDIRTTSGAVDSVYISDNQYSNITALNENIQAGVTNARSVMAAHPMLQSIYDPPSLAAGAASPIQTTTINGAVLGDSAIVTGVRNMLGLHVVAYVSATNTVSWYVVNPQGNPNGTQDLPNTVFNVRVQKMA